MWLAWYNSTELLRTSGPWVKTKGHFCLHAPGAVFGHLCFFWHLQGEGLAFWQPCGFDWPMSAACLYSLSCVLGQLNFHLQQMKFILLLSLVPGFPLGIMPASSRQGPVCGKHVALLPFLNKPLSVWARKSQPVLGNFVSLESRKTAHDTPKTVHYVYV